MEVAFSFSEIEFSKESFILASENGIFINYKLCAFTQTFFHLVDTMLETRLNPFSLIFSNPNSGSSFSSKWKRIFFIECFIPASGNRFSA